MKCLDGQIVFITENVIDLCNNTYNRKINYDGDNAQIGYIPSTM